MAKVVKNTSVALKKERIKEPIEDITISHGFRGDSNLKRAGEPVEWTEERQAEYIKCSIDPIYFAENYMKIVHVDRGLVPFILYDYQKEMMKSMAFNRNTILVTGRQIGKSTVTCGFILWYVLFHDSKTVALLANKGDTAREIMGKVSLAYSHLPKWLQQGVLEANKGSLVLENGSRVIATSTSGSAIRGYSINCVGPTTTIFLQDKLTNMINILSIEEAVKMIEKLNDSYGYVYLTTNTINNKKYIGLRRLGVSVQRPNYLGSGILLKKAIKKYGAEVFVQEILDYCKDEEHLIEAEKHQIALYCAVEDPNFYNISSGGKNPILVGKANGFFGKNHSAETKARWAADRKGKIISEEQKAKTSVSSKKRWSDPEYAERMKQRNPRNKFTDQQKREHSKKLTGKITSQGTKDKLSEAAKIRFKDPEFREKFRASFKDRDYSSRRTPEFKEKARLRMIEVNRKRWNKE